MYRSILIALAISASPMAALAMPQIGDILGTNPAEATAALDKHGYKVTGFEAEGGKIEAKCKDAATGAAMEVYIDPRTGKVTDIKSED